MSKIQEVIAKKREKKKDALIPQEIKDFVERFFARISRGERGDKGDKGDSIIGPPGPPGKSIKGDKGDKPIAGIDYSIPKNGKDGKPGKDVDEKKVIESVIKRVPKPKDGSPDTPEQIAKKLNTLTEKVDISVIRGLKQIINTLTKSVREGSARNGGGGGMGNVFHEVFSISQGTTSITTEHPIGAGGNAIFKSAYQGQVLDKDVHFTVGGNRRTVTFDSAVQAQFVDNTFVSFTYMRG